MIVDEPTAGLDLAASSGLLKTITELNREHGITVIFVTHDLQMASRPRVMWQSSRTVAYNVAPLRMC